MTNHSGEIFLFLHSPRPQVGDVCSWPELDEVDKMFAKLPAWDVGDSSIDNKKQATSFGVDDIQSVSVDSANAGSASEDSQQTPSDAERMCITNDIDVRLTCWEAIARRMSVVADYMAFEAAENKVLARHNALLALDLEMHTVPGSIAPQLYHATLADVAVLGAEVARRQALGDWLLQRYQDIHDQFVLFNADGHSIKSHAVSLLFGLSPDESRFDEARNSVDEMAIAIREVANLLSTRPIRCINAQTEIQAMLNVPGEFHPPASWQMGLEEWYLSMRG